MDSTTTVQVVTFEIWHKKTDSLTWEDLLENMPEDLNITHDKVGVLAAHLRVEKTGEEDVREEAVNLGIDKVLDRITKPDSLWKLDNCKEKDRASKAGDILVLMDDFHGVGIRIYVLLDEGVILFKS